MAKIMDYIRVGDYQSADADEDGYVDFHMDPLDEFWETFSDYYVGEEGIYESEGGREIFPQLYVTVHEYGEFVRVEYGDLDHDDYRTYDMTDKESAPWIEEAKKVYWDKYGKPYPTHRPPIS